jgi:APA family basic amino acid/polyamine antiporter
MSRDHLLPPAFSKVSRRFGAPYRTTLATGVAVALLAFFVELTTLAELVNIGTLFAFIVVAIGIVVLRRTRPDLERSYRTPAVPLVPILAVLSSLWLMLNLPAETWERFAIWMCVGLVVYFAYARSHSRVT